MTESKFMTKGIQVLVDGKPFAFNGYNLGNWMMLERFMFGFPGVDQIFRTNFKYFAGEKKYDYFFDKYYTAYFTEKDAQFLKNLGVSVLRLPFNYRVFESDSHPYEYSAKPLRYIDAVISICSKYEIYVVLDYHAAQGYENRSHCCDNPAGFMTFYTDGIQQERFMRLWEYIAEYYKNNEWVIGYDLLNEPSPDENEVKSLLEIYKKTINRIRAIDKNHLIIIEGTQFSCCFDNFHERLDEKLIISPHYYITAVEYFEELSFDQKIAKVCNDIEIRSKYAVQINAPCWFGEIGLSSNMYPIERLEYLDLTMQELIRRGYSWCLWTYKDLYRMGLLSVAPESAWMKHTSQYFDLKSKYWLDMSQYQIDPFDKTFISEVEKDFAEFDTFPGIKQMLWVNYQNAFAQILGRAYAKHFAGLPESILTEMIDSFLFENCLLKQSWFEVIKLNFDCAYKRGKNER